MLQMYTGTLYKVMPFSEIWNSPMSVEIDWLCAVVCVYVVCGRHWRRLKTRHSRDLGRQVRRDVPAAVWRSTDGTSRHLYQAYDGHVCPCAGAPEVPLRADAKVGGIILHCYRCRLCFTLSVYLLLSKIVRFVESCATPVRSHEIYPIVVWRPGSRKPPRISAQILYCQKLESLGYIFVADSVGLSSFKFLWWAPKDACVLKHSA